MYIIMFYKVFNKVAQYYRWWRRK